MANGLDRSVRAELLPEAPDTHLYDVRARVEAVSPDLGEQAFAADDFSGV
jgi:hypothetical protein